MTTQTPPSLKQVQLEFSNWRANKKYGERIPEKLWNKVAQLMLYFPLTQIARALGLSHAQIKKRGLIKPQVPQNTAKQENNNFVDFFDLSQHVTSALKTNSTIPNITIQRGESILSFHNPNYNNIQHIITAFMGL